VAGSILTAGGRCTENRLMHRLNVESAPPRADVLIGPQQVERSRARIEAPANESLAILDERPWRDCLGQAGAVRGHDEHLDRNLRLRQPRERFTDTARQRSVAEVQAVEVATDLRKQPARRSAYRDRGVDTRRAWDHRAF